MPSLTAIANGCKSHQVLCSFQEPAGSSVMGLNSSSQNPESLRCWHLFFLNSRHPHSFHLIEELKSPNRTPDSSYKMRLKTAGNTTSPCCRSCLARTKTGYRETFPLASYRTVAPALSALRRMMRLEAKVHKGITKGSKLDEDH